MIYAVDTTHSTTANKATQFTSKSCHGCVRLINVHKSCLPLNYTSAGAEYDA